MTSKSCRLGHKNKTGKDGNSLVVAWLWRTRNEQRCDFHPLPCVTVMRDSVTKAVTKHCCRDENAYV